MTDWRDLRSDEVLALAPGPLAAFRRAISSLATAGDPLVLGLVRARVGGLLGLPADLLPALGPGDDRRRHEVADWPSGDQFSATDRVCLGFAEQFVMDVCRR
jgi:hypothetical protein